MIFLILKIFVYLIVAAGIGGAAGWLMRNLQAQKSEEEATRAMNEAKAKLPQIESLLRGRDDQLRKAKDELSEAKATLNGHVNELKANEQKLREQEREIKRLEQSAQAHRSADLGDMDVDAEGGSDTDDLIAELSQEIARLKSELETRDHDSATPDGEGVDEPREESLARVELEALQTQLVSLERSLERAQSDLRSEQDKVGELERERELQNKSIQVLHQQLEMERSRRASA
jgi:DNA repair exonuclease SbcCD ATPase subunit